MAMNSGTLAKAIEPKLLDLFDEMRKADDYTEREYAQKLSQIIADEVVKHIVSFGQITTTVTVASVSGVTPGTGVSGPGAGTGTGTIS